MEKKTVGKIVSVKKQWWLKVNTKMARKGTFDGAIFPHVIKVKYTVDGKEYIKRKWVKAQKESPLLGASVSIIYIDEKPKKAKIVC